MTNEIALIQNNLTGLRIREHDEATIKSSIAILVQKMFLIAGQTPDKKDITIICKEITADLQKRYKGMTLNEVDYALNAGVRGEYGEYFGINVVSINKWLRAYYNSDERKEAQRSKIFPEFELSEHEMTQEEIESVRKQATLYAWNRFKMYGLCDDCGNVAYNFLDKKGLIPFTVEEKKEMYVEAQKTIVQRAKNYASNVYQLEQMLEKNRAEAVKMKAKHIALNAYFARLKAGKRDLTELI
jgi:hypothetical protein